MNSYDLPLRGSKNDYTIVLGTDFSQKVSDFYGYPAEHSRTYSKLEI